MQSNTYMALKQDHDPLRKDDVVYIIAVSPQEPKAIVEYQEKIYALDSSLLESMWAEMDHTCEWLENGGSDYVRMDSRGKYWLVDREDGYPLIALDKCPGCDRPCHPQYDEYFLEDMNPEALLADGFEDAFMGIVQQFNRYLAVYDRDKCLNVLIERDGMTFTEAVEYFDFNVTGAWMGENTPAFFMPCSLPQPDGEDDEDDTDDEDDEDDFDISADELLATVKEEVKAYKKRFGDDDIAMSQVVKNYNAAVRCKKEGCDAMAIQFARICQRVMGRYTEPAKESSAPMGRDRFTDYIVELYGDVKRRDELDKYIKVLFDSNIELMRRKNADYANSDNPFKNLQLVEAFGVTDTSRGIATRMTDKFSRIINLLDKPPEVKDEKIQDSIKDFIVYLAILSAYIESGYHDGGDCNE